MMPLLAWKRSAFSLPIFVALALWLCGCDDDEPRDRPAPDDTEVDGDTATGDVAVDTGDVLGDAPDDAPADATDVGVDIDKDVPDLIGYLPCLPSINDVVCTSGSSNLSCDPSNCGQCGNDCGAGRACVLGMCRQSGVASETPLTQGQWTDLGPVLGGRLTAIVADRTDPDDLIVGSPGGGVWIRPTGQPWRQPTNGGLADASVQRLEWDHGSDNLFAITDTDLYGSADQGETWENLTDFGGYPGAPWPQHHRGTAGPFDQLDLADGHVVLWSRPCDGLFYSIDGTTFQQLWPFEGDEGNPANCIPSIAADDVTGRVYLGTLELNDQSGPVAVYRSNAPWTAAGPPEDLAWELVNSGLPISAYAPNLVWTGQADRLAVVLEATGTQVFFTTDGESWTASGSPLPEFTFGPRPFVWLGDDQLLLGTVQALETHDLGESWDRFDTPEMHFDTRAFFFQDYGGGQAYVWAATDGVFALDPLAYNIARFEWTLGQPLGLPTEVAVARDAGLRVWQPHALAVTADGGPLFMGSIDNGSVCSDDGSTWVGPQFVTDGQLGAPPGLGCADVWSVVIAPSDPDRAYSRSCVSDALGRTDNATAGCSDTLWMSMTPEIPLGRDIANPNVVSNAMTAVHPSDPDRAYLATFFSFAVTDDGFATLHFASAFDDVRPVSLLAVADEAADSGATLYVGSNEGGIYRTFDEGETREEWGLNDDSPYAVMAMAHTTAGGDGGTFWAATSDGLYRRSGAGDAEWEQVVGGNGYTVGDVEVDPHCPSRVYAAFGFTGTDVQHRGGIIVSHDLGETWQSVTLGTELQQSPVSDIQVDPASAQFLTAAVYGRGAWRYDWGQAPACPSN